MATAKPITNTLYFFCKRLYLPDELDDPHFLLLENKQQAKMKLSAKLKIPERVESHLALWIFCRRV